MANSNKNYKILTNFKEIELYNSISDIKEKNTFISSNALTIYNNIINILKDTDVNDIISMRNNLNNINYISHDESDIYFDNNYRDNDYSEFAELLNTIIEKLEEDDNFDNYSRELLVQLQTKINGVLANIYTNNDSNDDDIENLKQSVEESLSSDSALNEKYGNNYNELKDENTGNIIRQYEDPKNYKTYAAQILNIIECKKTYIAPSESSNTYTIIVGPTDSGDEPEPQPEAPDTIDVNGVTYYKVQPQSPGENYRLDTYHSPVYDIDYYAWIANDEPVQKISPELAWSTESITVQIGETNTFPTLTNPHSVTVSYSSSDSEKATIDASTGEITLVAEGNTTISATFTGDDTYEAQTVTYTLTIEEIQVPLTYYFGIYSINDNVVSMVSNNHQVSIASLGQINSIDDIATVEGYEHTFTTANYIILPEEFYNQIKIENELHGPLTAQVYIISINYHNYILIEGEENSGDSWSTKLYFKKVESGQGGISGITPIDETTPAQPSGYYYWYVGTSIPSSTSGNGWTSLGTDLSGISYIQVDTSNNPDYSYPTFYVIMPSTLQFKPYNSDGTRDESIGWTSTTWSVDNNYTLWTLNDPIDSINSRFQQ